MRILHISDLHLTSQFTTLDDAFLGVSQHPLVARAPFDFVVVSGDLSQRADAAEYEQLLTFAESTLLALLNDPSDRARVIFVPGNHDVCWSTAIGQEVSLGELAETESPSCLEELLQRAVHQPAASPYRIKISRYGHVRVFKIDRSVYGQRFAKVQAFLERFYGGALQRAPHRMFQLTGTTAQAWSAHVFPSEGVAFFGFNSCSANDAYWHGARIDPDAISAAARHWRNLAKGCRPVAVWHHGLSSDEQRPDYLVPADLGRLFSAGFRLGFHGHTHVSQAANLETYFGGTTFNVIATGSLGAGSKERPDAVGNQFSLVDLLGPFLRVRTFERQGQARIYSLERDEHIWTRNKADAKQPKSIARFHKRSCYVDGQGIANVTVELEGVELRGPLVLELLEPPFGGIVFEPSATTDRGSIKVIGERLGDGRFRCTLDAIEGELENLTWSYRVSNTLALNQAERALLPRYGKWLPNLSEREQVRPYTVRFPCEKLELSLEYATPTLEGQPCAFVERRTGDSLTGTVQWERVQEEQSRATLEQRGGVVSLSIHAPSILYRYGIVHRLREGDSKPDEEGLRWASTVLRQCRDGTRAESPDLLVDRALTRAIDHALGDRIEDLTGIRWLGMLWDEETRELVTAFGNFRAARFRVGSGVVGHAVRFRGATGWHRNGSSLIYESRSPDGSARHEWIVAVPLSVEMEKRSPVGAISLWAQDQAGAGSKRLAKMVGDFEYDQSQSPPLAEELLVYLNQVFWRAAEALGLLASWPELAMKVAVWNRE